MRGIQGGSTVPDLSEDLAEPAEWLEQHHKKTMNKSQTNIQASQSYLNIPSHHNNNAINNTYNSHVNKINQIVSSMPTEYPYSGDESDNHHNQMEHLRSQFYTPDPQKRTKEYHMEQAALAIELLKTATRSNGWKKVDKHKSGCMVYQSVNADTIPTHRDIKYPAYKGEHIIRGYKAQDVFSIVSVRKLWDDWYDEVSCVEAYDESTSLVYIVMKGTLSSKTRDVALVERIEHDRDGTIYYAACSIESSKIPRVSGKVRAEISIAGWVIQPLPSNPPITKMTYVIQTDLLSRLPRFIAKRSLAKRAMAIAVVEAYLKKNGSPAVSSVSQNRKRSFSEPIKLDRFLLPEESDDDEPFDHTFLGPTTSKHNLGFMSDNVESEDNLDDLKPPRHHHELSSAKSTASTIRDSHVSSNTLFTKEFMESSSFLDNSNLFGNSSFLFGDDSNPENKKKQVVLPDTPPNSQPLPSVMKQQTLQEISEERPQKPIKAPIRPPPPPPPNASKTYLSDSESRKTPSPKRVSIPVVAPKSEARSKQSLNPSTNQLVVPVLESQIPVTKVTPDSPPLTPPASINGKDATSDSDVAHSMSVKSVKSVKMAPSPEPEKLSPNTAETNSESTSLAMSSLAMKSPSAMMEATRRHSALINRPTGFVPRHSHGVPIRGNPNVSLQSLTRPSGPNSSMTAISKRHSAALSIDSNKSSALLTPLMVLPHRHSETSRKALAMFKVLASSPEDRWRAISSEGGFKSYSRVISGAGLPMLRSEGTITGGWTVEQINAVIESSGCRQTWDERFENMSIAETFNHNEYLFHVSLRGVGSMTGRDLAGVTIIDRDPLTSALFNVSTSVLDATIPEDPGRIRGMLELSGWSLRPTFDGQGNTLSVNVTFVIQIDIRGNLPATVVRSMTSSMGTTVSRLNQFINKTGYPPFASHISGTRLLDTFVPQTGFYELCYKAAPGWTEVRIGRKVYKEGYDFFIKPDDPSVKVEMAPDFGGVRVWTTLDHEGQSIVAQVSRKGQNVIEDEVQQMDTESKNVSKSEIEDDQRHSNYSTRQRSASYASPSTQDVNSFMSSRPDSQASVASKASVGSERSRRGRSTRPLVTLPAGTPPPPLPRRGSSLTRYSIPISEYLPGADAPPVPVNAGLPVPNDLALPMRPISESLASPTLGFFHVPVIPPSNTATSANSLNAPSSPISPMESISSVMSEKTEPEKSVAIAAATADDQKVEVVSIATEKHSLSSTGVPQVLKLPEEKKAEDVISLSSQVSPANTPVPSPMTSTFNPRSSSLLSSLSVPSVTVAAAAAAAAMVATPAQLKGAPPSAMLVGATKKREVRVTFSMDTIDKSKPSEDASVVRNGVFKINNGHSVKIVEADVHEQHAAVVEQGSDSESDTDFVEARENLTDDEMEFVLVLATIGAWPTSLELSRSIEEKEARHEGEEVVAMTVKAFEKGLRIATSGSPTEVKIAIVFLLLVYYAGRLSSFIA
ncbi:hypothetical protein BGZ76_001048 [Entomortierella beljakovae]|nr:hypothetical protein BGZ76_001048 [Entomortierella beljakovae]